MKKALYWVLIGVFSLIFLISAYILTDYFIASHQEKQQWNDIQNMFTPGVTTEGSKPAGPIGTTNGTTTVPVQTTRPTLPDPTVMPSVPRPTQPGVTEPGVTLPPTQPVVPPTTIPTVPTVPTVPSVPPTTQGEPVMLPEFSTIYALNNDVVGYIIIEDTNINYPILYHPEERDYYLNRDFYGNYSRSGCIYLREACNIFEPTDVLTVYGHNMATGAMFADIHKYRSKSFFNNHQYINVWTLYEKHTYQVVCLFKTSGTYGVGFPFHLFDDFRDEAEYNEFINGVRDLAIFDTGIETQYGDKFICLSTCEYTIDNGRLVLVAKRID